MSAHTKQMIRLVKLVAELRSNNYPNATSFVELLRQADVDENIDIACSSRTFMRDIETLADAYRAPIEYDHTHRGYYLKNQDWEFNCFPAFEDHILPATMIGSRLATDILPTPLKNMVEDSINTVLTQNTSNFFDTTMLQTLLCMSGIKASIDPEQFMSIFNAWRMSQVVQINYKSTNGKEANHLFEPHIIAFHKGIWYTKGYTYKTKDIKVFAIQRILSVNFGIDNFVSSKKLLDQTHRNGLFNYPKIEGIQLRCDPTVAFYFYEHQKIKKFKIDPQDDGSLLITLRPSIEHEIIRFVLGEAGKVEIISPPELRKKITLAAQKIQDIHG